MQKSQRAHWQRGQWLDVNCFLQNVEHVAGPWSWMSCGVQETLLCGSGGSADAAFGAAALLPRSALHESQPLHEQIPQWRSGYRSGLHHALHASYGRSFFCAGLGVHAMRARIESHIPQSRHASFGQWSSGSLHHRAHSQPSPTQTGSAPRAYARSANARSTSRSACASWRRMRNLRNRSQVASIRSEPQQD